MDAGYGEFIADGTCAEGADRRYRRAAPECVVRARTAQRVPDEVTGQANRKG